VVIGTKAGCSNRVPTIGDNVFIGPGAKIFGAITIANGIAIGANSVVTRSFLEPNVTIAGIPARKVNNKGSKCLLVDALEVIQQRKENKHYVP
jgi:serine O-acetyltransferase